MSQNSDNCKDIKGNHGFKMIFEGYNRDIEDKIYFLKAQTRGFLKMQIDRKTSIEWFYRSMKFIAHLGRQYIYSLKKEFNYDFKLNYMSAAID